MEESHFSLKWENFYPKVFSSIELLQKDESFVDVTVVCEDSQFKAHKIILSACSSFFCEILKGNPCQHPIIVMNGIKATDLGDVLQYIYQGHVNVSSERLRHVLHVAEMLKIVGLSGCEIGTLPDLDQSEVLEEDVESTYYNNCSSLIGTPMRTDEESIGDDHDGFCEPDFDKSAPTILSNLTASNIKMETPCSDEAIDTTSIHDVSHKSDHNFTNPIEISSKSFLGKSLHHANKVRNRKLFHNGKIEISPGSGVYLDKHLLNKALSNENPNIAARELFRMLFTEEELSNCTLRRLPINGDGHRSCLDQNVVNAVLDLVTTTYHATQKQKIVHSLQTLLVKSRKSWLKYGGVNPFCRKLLSVESNISAEVVESLGNL